MSSSLRNAGRLLVSALVLLATFRCNPARLRSIGAEPVWLALTAIMTWSLNDWIKAEADRSFDATGLASMLAAGCVLIGVMTATRSADRNIDLGAVAATIAGILTWFGAFAVAAQFGWDPIVEWLQVPRAWQPALWQSVEIVAAVWCLLALWRLGAMATRDSASQSDAKPGSGRRVGATLVAGCLAASLLLPSRPVFEGASAEPGSPGLLHIAAQFVDSAFAKKAPPQPRLPRIDVEAIYYRQPELVRQALAGLQPSRPDRPEIYFLGAATFAGQHVFMREVISAKAIVDERFDTAGRSLLLVNHRDTVGDLPLANVANLEAILAGLGGVMDREKDLLFLYITSHGSPGEIAVQFPGFSPNQITPERLRRMLDQSGIKHKLVVISACYSGSFIPALRGADTVVLTAARPDRTSFGCSDERDWTYFGDAYFNHALRQTHSFGEAFEAARKLVSQWEAEQKVDPSEPQIAAGTDALAKINEIAGRFNAQATDSARPR